MFNDKSVGGSAFPRAGYPPVGSGQVDGMSIRDYFAAKAMQGILCSGKGIHSDQFMLSRDAYEVADAMLKERAK